MSTSRLFYIDNLRIALTVLVILVHLAINYGAPGDWYFNDTALTGELSKILMTLFVAVSQSFFMGMFFMISSFFAPDSIDRKGPAAFIKDRLIRLGIPLVFYTIILGALVNYSIAYLADGSEESFFSFYFRYLSQLHGGNVGPLWFVEFLLILSIIYGVWRRLSKGKADDGNREYDAPSNINIALFAIGLGLATFIVRLWMPRGTEFAPLHLQIPYTPQYIALFVVGIIAAHRNWFATISRRSAKIWSIIVLLMLVAFPIVVLTGSGPDGDLSVFDGGANWQSLVAAMWEQMIGVAIIIVLVVYFRSTFNRQNKYTRAMSGSAYMAYIIHPVIVVPLAIILTGIELESQIKFIVFAPIMVCITFFVGNMIRRVPIITSIV